MEESSGSSRIRPNSTDKSESASSLKGIPSIESSQKKIGEEADFETEDLEISVLGTGNNSNVIDLSSTVYQVVDVEPTESKADLQIELLRQKIEYTKRDIYHRELSILEKEKALSLSEEERILLLENTKSNFNERNTI